MVVDRDEVNAGTDLSLTQFLNEPCSVSSDPLKVETERIDVQRRLDLGPLDRNLNLRQRPECPVVAVNDLPTAPLELGEPPQLDKTESSLKVSHVVLEPGRDDLVTPGSAR